jgi:hypothetical protein
MELPMLDEDEWAEIAPFLDRSTESVKSYREEHGVGLKEALRQGFDEPALRKFEELTGFKETNVNAIFHHRRSLYGPECPNCGKLIRTSRARFCAECGYKTGIN